MSTPTSYICVSCSKELPPAIPNMESYQPESGVAFTGEGNYGSIYDLSKEMVITVCDDCITKAIEANAVHIIEKPIMHQDYIVLSKASQAYDSNRSW